MKKGFTIIEAVIVLVLTGLLSLVVSVYIREGFSAWHFMSGQKNVALSTRAALTQITRELKRCNQNTNITTHTTTEVRFIDIYSSNITFSQSGTNLMRNSDVLLEDLQNPGGLIFTYLDNHGNPTNISNQINLVKCRVTVIKGENRFVAESAARIRVKRIK